MQVDFMFWNKIENNIKMKCSKRRLFTVQDLACTEIKEQTSVEAILDRIYLELTIYVYHHM